jgi:hypothetical protein
MHTRVRSLHRISAFGTLTIFAKRERFRKTSGLGIFAGSDFCWKKARINGEAGANA